jgi:hypothetical protein
MLVWRKAFLSEAEAMPNYILTIIGILCLVVIGCIVLMGVGGIAGVLWVMVVVPVRTVLGKPHGPTVRLRDIVAGPVQRVQLPPRPVIPESVRVAVLERDDYKCVHCGSTHDLQIDHVVPFSKGGASNPDNYEVLCETCNHEKGASP